MDEGKRQPQAPPGERLLWSLRFLLLAAVVGTSLAALVTMFAATVDVVALVGKVSGYIAADDRSSLREDVLSNIVKVLDLYLIAAILVLVAFGLYELFIGRIDARRADEDAPRLLVIASLDDLKDRIAKLIILILVIEFFDRALSTRVDDALDLLLLAGGIAFASLSSRCQRSSAASVARIVVPAARHPKSSRSIKPYAVLRCR